MDHLDCPIRLTVGMHELHLFLPAEPSDTLVLLHGEPQQAVEVWALLDAPKPMLASISGTDWNRDFSPWPAARAFSGGADFGGEAERYLHTLLQTLLPAVEGCLPAAPKHYGLTGYSLAGLFSVYACTQTDLFDRIACISGSLWYDDFVSFLRSVGFYGTLDRAFFSLGDREAQTKNPRMATVAACTEQVCEYLAANGIPVIFRQTRGGHFQQVSARIAEGINCISH